jgi:hypothetical protein
MPAQTPAHDVPNPDLLAILPTVERSRCERVTDR